MQERGLGYLKVKVNAGSRRQGVAGWQGDALKVTVRAVPERGKANDAVCGLLAKRLGIPATQVTLRRGATSREKLLFVDGLSDDELRQRLSGPA